MTRTDRKNIVSAYALLAMILWLGWKLLFNPALDKWRGHVSKTQNLNESLSQLQSRLSTEANISARLIDSVRAQAEIGKLSTSSISSEAGHKLDQTLKSALDMALPCSSSAMQWAVDGMRVRRSAASAALRRAALFSFDSPSSVIATGPMARHRPWPSIRSA